MLSGTKVTNPTSCFERLRGKQVYGFFLSLLHSVYTTMHSFKTDLLSVNDKIKMIHGNSDSIPLCHTHYTLSVSIELVHLLLTAARFVPAVRASRRMVRASWLVYQGNSLA